MDKFNTKAKYIIMEPTHCLIHCIMTITVVMLWRSISTNNNWCHVYVTRSQEICNPGIISLNPRLLMASLSPVLKIILLSKAREEFCLQVFYCVKKWCSDVFYFIFELIREHKMYTVFKDESVTDVIITGHKPDQRTEQESYLN